MDLGIRGRKALLSGASRGLGKASAMALAEAGVDVTIVARTKDVLEATAEEIRTATGVTVTAVTGDGREPGDFKSWTQNDWMSALNTMMLCHIEMMRLTHEGMMARGFGRIVNIVSRSVKIPQLEMGLSNGARSGLVGFVAGLARQTVARNVTINNLLPGIFDSDAQKRHIEAMLDDSDKSFQQIWDDRARGNPAKRYGRPAELGNYCAFLCSEHAGFITGQNLLIDGGSYPGTF
jgi:3-oxoacyl-[acyl-carrier protein] reductase